MYTNIKGGFLLVLLMALATLSFGQCISGSTSVCVGQTVTYTLNPGDFHKASYTFGGGTKTAGGTFTSNYITINWTTAGWQNIYVEELDPNYAPFSCSLDVLVTTVVGGSVSGSATICQGSSQTLTLSGYSGTIVRWEKSTDGGSNWQTISNTSASYNTGSLSSTTTYRAVVSNCSANANSSNATVTVSVPNAGSASLSSGSGSFCSGESASGTVIVSGYSGTVSSWQKSEFISGSWGSWVNAGAGHDVNYFDFGVTVPTRFRAVIGAGVCGTIYSGYYEIVETQPTVAGNVSGPSQVCAGSSFSLSLTGSVGTVQAWYKRNVGGSYGGNIGSVSNISISQPAYFKAAVKNGNCTTTLETPEFFVDIFPPAVGGTMASTNGTAFCNSGTVNLSLSGYTGVVQNWYYQYNDGSGWSSWTTFGTASASSNSLALTSNGSANRSYQFYAVVQNAGCTTANSSTVSATVYTNTVAGTLSVNQSSLCSSGSASLSVSGNVGSITRYMSRSQDNGGTWSSWASTSSTPSLSTVAGVNRTYQFQSFAQNGTCAEVGSNIVSTTGYANPTTGTLSSSAPSFCSSGTVSLSASNFYSTAAQWQYRYSDDAGASYGNWSTFSTATTSPQSLSMTAGNNVDRIYQLQLIAQNGTCSAATSNTVSVTVNTNYTGTLSNTLIEAYGVASGSFSITNPAGNFQKWVQSTDNGVTWPDATGVNTSTTYNYSNVTTSTQFRAVIVNGTCTNNSPVINLIIYNVPTIQLTGTTVPALALGNSLTLQSGSSYSTYQWIKNGTDIANANGTSIGVYEPGYYQLRVKATSTAPYTTTGNFIVFALGYQPDNTANMVVTTVIKKAGVNPGTNLYTALQQSEYAQSISYTDNLSRPTQTIVIGQSPQQKDIVQPFTYDSLQSVSWLPYVTTTRDGWNHSTALSNSGSYTSSEQYLFYQNTAKVASSTAPFAKTTYESSPQARVLEQGTTGTEFQPGTVAQPGAHTVKPEFHINAANDVKQWTMSGPGSYYPAGALAVSKAADQNGNAVMTYTDKAGNTVLKRVQIDATIEGTSVAWLETYYVYDIRGNLVMQVPPKAVQKLNTGTTWDNTFRDQWCFYYTYSSTSRLQEKKVPGSAVTYSVYDTLGRVVLTQDGNLRAQNKWAFVKYDMLGRPVMSGLYTNATNTTRSAVQTLVRSQYSGSAPYFEDRGTTLHGYTNQSFPTQNADASALEILSVSYYDTYDFDYNGTADYSYTAQGITGEGAQGNSFDLPTGSKKIILGTGTWLYTYQFYDRFGRVIQSRGNNHLSSAIDNLTTVIYDFEGKVLQTKTYHNAGGSNQTTVIKKMSYDHAGRVTKIYQNLNGEPNDQLVAQYNYNELGQVVEKNLHLLYDASDGQTGTLTADDLTQSQYNGENQLIARNSIKLLPGYNVKTDWKAALTAVTQAQAEANGRYLQSVDYRYNIQGRLTSINNAQLTADNSVTNDDSNDYFGIELLYHTQDAGINNTAYYNGNVSAVKWKNGGVATGAADQRSFKYSYDKSDKLLSSTFQSSTSTDWTKETNTLNESFSYDASGNILSLTRSQNLRGLSGINETSAPQAIDNLTYTYASGNQLSKVEDAISGTNGFNNGANNTTEYTYTTDGSLIKDDNKGISNITYNVLGKPVQITYTGSPARTVSYTYDAAGAKLKLVTYDGTNTTTTDYVGGFVYNNSALSFFSSPEGRVVKSGNNLEYQYSIADHQGNTRVVFTSAAPTVKSTLANFEGDTNDQSSQFTNVPTPIPSGAGNHTPGGSYVIRMNQTVPVGPGLSKKVYPGDKVDMEAYSYYESTSGYGTSNTGITGMMTAISNVLIASTGGVDAGGLKNGGVNSALSNFGVGANQGDYAPAAFLNYILFDADYKVMTAGWQVVTATPFSKEQVKIPTITVKEAGYIFVYLSYEDQSDKWVYFDDFKVSVTPTNIIQSNEYYAHGLQTAKSWTRDGNSNNFLANGGTELNATTGLMDLEFRNFDPVLGRMHQVDPMADKYSSHTPYNYAFNSPAVVNDVNGADPITGNDRGGGYVFPVRMDGNHLRGGGGGHRDPDHPFAGWMGGYGGAPTFGVFGSLGDTPFGSGEYGQMTADAQAVRDGRMSIDGYATIYGRSVPQAQWGYLLGGLQYIVGGSTTAATRTLRAVGLGIAVAKFGGEGRNPALYPKVTLIKGSIDGFIAHAKFSVEGVKADGIRIMQTVIGKNYLGDGKPPGEMTWTSGNDVFHAFVDGGVNSPSGGVTPGLPFYPAANLFDPDTGVGVISFHDEPTAGLFWWSLSFETSIVATNYNGTGVDQVLASFQWGYDTMRSTTSVISLQPGISAQSAAIIRYDYPNYGFK